MIELPGIRIAVLKSSADTDGHVAVFKEYTSPGKGPPLHRHLEQTEVFHVLKGTYKFFIEEETQVLSAGDCAVVPPNTAHAFRNMGDEEGELLFELCPALDADLFFKQLSETADKEKMPEVFSRHLNELVGPAPL